MTPPLPTADSGPVLDRLESQDGLLPKTDDEDETLAADGSQAGSSSNSFDVVLADAKEVGTQSSVVTIFSIWNTMMGTSILVMPWALSQAGFTLGILLILFFGIITCYSAYLAAKTTDDLKIIKGLRSTTFLEFADVCRHHLGKVGAIISIVFSLFALLGAIIVYYVLLSNFLYNSVDFIYHQATNSSDSQPSTFTYNNRTYHGIICKKLPYVPFEMRDPSDFIDNSTAAMETDPAARTALLVGGDNSSTSTYEKLWSQTKTVPIWLLIVILPLCSIKSPTYVAKLTAVGTISVAYLFILIFIKMYYWGINLDFASDHPYRAITHFSPSFPSLTGVCSLAFFIHNALQTLLRPQRNPENNGRDITIAFVCVWLTYTLIAVLFYVTFPLAKSCIEDNFLDNLHTDVPVAIARFLLFFQILAIFPMLIYIFRSQFMFAIFRDIYPNFWYVSSLQAILVSVCILFSIFFPNIGTIIQFIGALCGLVYIYTLPPLMTLLNKRALIVTGHLPSAASDSNSKLAQAENGGQANGNFGTLLIDSPPGSSSRSLVDRVWTFGRIASGRLTIGWWIMLIFFSVLVIIGLANFVAQFLVFFLK